MASQEGLPDIVKTTDDFKSPVTGESAYTSVAFFFFSLAIYPYYIVHNAYELKGVGGWCHGFYDVTEQDTFNGKSLRIILSRWYVCTCTVLYKVRKFSRFC